MELANIVPESDSAGRVVRHGTEVARVEEDCRVVRNLVADADTERFNFSQKHPEEYKKLYDGGTK